jgi:hypothetical protein
MNKEKEALKIYDQLYPNSEGVWRVDFLQVATHDRQAGHAHVTGTFFMKSLGQILSVL